MAEFTKARMLEARLLKDRDITEIDLQDALDMLEKAMVLVGESVENETEFETEWNKDARALLAAWEKE